MKGEKPRNLVGIEWEMRWAPRLGPLRATRKRLIEEKLLSAEQVQNSSQMMAASRALLKNTSEIIAKQPHYDGGGIEIVTQPATLKAHQALKSQYENIAEAFTILGFCPDMGGDGIHVNMDYSLFGKGTEQLTINIAKFFWFMFNEYDFVREFSGRRAGDQTRADILALMGHIFVDDPEEIRSAFISRKNEILNRVFGNEYDDDDFGLTTPWEFNMSFGRDGRQCVEFRWFGSTNSADKMLSIIEFCYALPAFCNEQESGVTCTLEHFCDWISPKWETYPHLIEDMTENVPSSADVFAGRERVIDEQPAPAEVKRKVPLNA